MVTLFKHLLLILFVFHSTIFAQEELDSLLDVYLYQKILTDDVSVINNVYYLHQEISEITNQEWTPVRLKKLELIYLKSILRAVNGASFQGRYESYSFNYSQKGVKYDGNDLLEILSGTKKIGNEKELYPYDVKLSFESRIIIAESIKRNYFRYKNFNLKKAISLLNKFKHEFITDNINVSFDFSRYDKHFNVNIDLSDYLHRYFISQESIVLDVRYYDSAELKMKFENDDFRYNKELMDMAQKYLCNKHFLLN